MSFKLKDLDQPIKSLKGETFLDPRSNKPLTFRDGLVSICELTKPDQGQLLQAYKLGFKLLEKKVELTKEELDFLKKLISSNSIYIAVITGRLMDYIESQIKESKGL